MTAFKRNSNFAPKPKKESDLVRIGSVWSKEGSDALSGSFDEDATENLAAAFEAFGSKGTKILVFKNTYKKTEKEPDFRIFIAPKKSASGYNGASNEATQEVAVGEAPAKGPKAAAKLPWQKK